MCLASNKFLTPSVVKNEHLLKKSIHLFSIKVYVCICTGVAVLLTPQSGHLLGRAPVLIHGLYDYSLFDGQLILGCINVNEKTICVTPKMVNLGTVVVSLRHQGITTSFTTGMLE